MLDTWFGAAGQPRRTNGQFAEKIGAEPEVSLNEPKADYDADGRDVLRYAVMAHGARWTTAEERQQVIDEYAAEYAVAGIASQAREYIRHPSDDEHKKWCASPERGIPELAKVLMHEEDPDFFLAVLARPDITPAMAHYAATHRDAAVARTAIRHDRISMGALLAVRDRYRRSAARAHAKRSAEPWPPAREHWTWLHERELETAARAEERLFTG